MLVRCKLREADERVADGCTRQVRSSWRRRPCAERVKVQCSSSSDRRHARKEGTEMVHTPGTQEGWVNSRTTENNRRGAERAEGADRPVIQLSTSRPSG